MKVMDEANIFIPRADNRSRKGAAQLKVMDEANIFIPRADNRSRKGAAQLKGRRYRAAWRLVVNITAPERERHN